MYSLFQIVNFLIYCIYLKSSFANTGLVFFGYYSADADYNEISQNDWHFDFIIFCSTLQWRTIAVLTGFEPILKHAS